MKLSFLFFAASLSVDLGQGETNIGSYDFGGEIRD